jgi:hypothetical protein
MVTRVEEWCENVLGARWFQWLLVGSVIYAAVWLYALPAGGMFEVAVWIAVGLWASVLTIMLCAILLAFGRGFKEHFLPWDGHERRWRERDQNGVQA